MLKKIFYYKAIIYTVCLCYVFSSIICLAGNPKTLPASTSAQSENKQNPLDGLSKKVNLDLRNLEVVDFLKFIAIKGNLNIVINPAIQGKVSIFVKNITVGNALKLALNMNNLAFEIEDEGVIKVLTNEEYEVLYGKPFNDRRETKIVNFKHILPQDIKAILGEIKSKTGKVIINNSTKTIVIVDIPEKITEMEKIIASMELPVITKSYELDYADITKVSAEINKILTKGLGQMSTDERTGAIIVSDYKDKLKKIDKLIKKFDRRSREVLIEAKIIQIRLNETNQMGVNWRNFMPSSRSFDLVGAFSIVPAISQGQKIAVGSIDAGDNFETIIEALNTYGESNIISSPHITTLEGQEARIHVGTSEPYTTGSTNSTTVSQIVSDNVQFIDVGVKLVVTPTISKDGFIVIKIKPEISDKVDTFVSPSGQSSVPVIKKSEAETTVMVKDGVTIIIGGLIEDKVSESETGVPVLSKIPLLGFLFRSTTKEKIKTELVTFITPHLISGIKDIKSATNIKRHKPKRVERRKKRKPKRNEKG